MEEENIDTKIDNSADIDEDIEESESQVYELGYHIVSSVGEENLAAETSNIKELIEKAGGIFVSEDYPKSVKLAYEISKSMEGKNQKFDNAYFGWIKFEIKKEDVMKIKEGLDGNANILRFIIIKTVRESTTAPKITAFDKKAKILPKKTKALSVRKEEKKEIISEEELDKTIEELVV